MTFREFCLRAIAHERMVVQGWQQTRFLALKVLEPYLAKNANVTVFDILPLPGDPTKEDLKEQGKKQMQSSIDAYHARKAQYIAMGLITEKNADSTPTP